MNNALFIRSLSWSVTEGELQRLFESVGTVESVSIPKDRETGRSKGFAFVTMDSVESATQAIQQLSNTALGGRTIIIDYQDHNKSRSGGSTVAEAASLFIKGLPYDADEASLADWLSAAGQVDKVSIPTDRITGEVRGFAFVDMASTNDAKQVIQQLGNQRYQGTPVQIRYKNPDREKSFSGGQRRRSYSR